MVNVLVTTLEQCLLATAPAEVLALLGCHFVITAGVLYSLGVEAGTFPSPLECFRRWSVSNPWYRRQRYRALLFQVLPKRGAETPDRYVDADACAVSPGNHPGVEWLPGGCHLDHGAPGGALVSQAITVVAIPRLCSDPTANVVSEPLTACSQAGVS